MLIFSTQNYFKVFQQEIESNSIVNSFSYTMYASKPSSFILLKDFLCLQIMEKADMNQH